MSKDEALKAPIFQSIVGSQAWGMDRPDSDHDFFVVYQASTLDILAGRKHGQSYFDQSTPGVDYQIHEAGHVVEQVLKGNVNFLQGLTSPCLVGCNRQGFELMRLTRLNPARNCFDSIRGMALANYRKYLLPKLEWGHEPEEWWEQATLHDILDRVENATGPVEKRKALDPSPKRCATIVRNCGFGVTLLDTGKFEFRAVGPCGIPEVEEAMRALEEAHNRSSLPEVPDEEPFREWLLNLRLSQVG